MDFPKTLIRRHCLILLFISFIYLEYFKVRNFPWDILWGITRIAKFIEFRKDLLSRSKQKNYYSILVVHLNKYMILLKLIQHFSEEMNQNYDQANQTGKSIRQNNQVNHCKVLLK